MMQFSAEQARWYRLNAQGLVRAFTTASEAARRLSGVQAQILPAAGLALSVRVSPTFGAADLEQALYDERSLVKLWGQRSTLHLYPSSDWPLIYGAHDALPTYWERVADRRGDDKDSLSLLLDQVIELLRSRGTLGRSDLRGSGLPLTEEHVSGWGGLFAILVRRGLACHADPLAGEARIAFRESWLPDLAWAPPDTEAANTELARRYLEVYGPATVQDLAYWRGRGVGDTKRWLANLGAAVTTVSIDGIPQLMLSEQLEALAARPPAPDGWPVHLLPRFDTLLLSHRLKSHLIEPEHYARVWRPAGHIEATLLVRGRIAGTWRYDWHGGGVVITIRPFKTPPAYVRRAAERRALAVARHFGVPLAELQWNVQI